MPKWRRFAYFGRFLLLISLVGTVGFAPQDSSRTTVQGMGNIGQYGVISRGCDGTVTDKYRAPLREVSASLDHRPSPSSLVGINGSLISSSQKHSAMTRSFPYKVFALNPFLNLDRKHVGLGGGFLWMSRELPISGGSWSGGSKGFPTYYLRFGNPQKAYVDVSVFHTVPLSGGYFKLGLGSKGHPKTNWWLGLGLLPYDGFGVTVITQTRLRPKLCLNALMRLGDSEGIAEGTVGLGITYQLQGKKEPPGMPAP